MHGSAHRTVPNPRASPGKYPDNASVPSRCSGTAFRAVWTIVVGRQPKRFLRQVRSFHTNEPVLNLTCLGVSDYNLHPSRLCSFSFSATQASLVYIYTEPRWVDIYCLILGSMFFYSVEVNNFLKIDENQNEEVENELSESPVSRNCSLTQIFFPKHSNIFIMSPILCLTDVPEFTKFTGWGNSVSSFI